MKSIDFGDNGLWFAQEKGERQREAEEQKQQVTGA